jgi:hypothetical protein
MDMDIAKGCKAICYGKKTKGREVRNWFYDKNKLFSKSLTNLDKFSANFT